MPAFTSAAAFFRAAHGKRVIRRQNIKTIDTWPDVVAAATSDLIGQGCPAGDITEDETGLRWPGAFIMKPKVAGVMSGVFTVKSAEYLFREDGNA